MKHQRYFILAKRGCCCCSVSRFSLVPGVCSKQEAVSVTFHSTVTSYLIEVSFVFMSRASEGTAIMGRESVAGEHYVL